MPNHVYAHISVEEKYADKLKEIAKVGLAQYYRPQPSELNETSSPARIVSQEEYDKQMKLNETEKFKHYPLTEELHKELIDKYGFDNWHDWNCAHWGTKWGCYENEMDGEQYRFTTAWSPLSEDIIEMLAKDIPNFFYTYEEEQGWGAEMEYVNGERSTYFEWDAPDFSETEHEGILFLENDYQNGEGTFKKGYYADWCLHEYLGETWEKQIN